MDAICLPGKSDSLGKIRTHIRAAAEGKLEYGEFIDFSYPAAVAWYQGLLRGLLAGDDQARLQQGIVQWVSEVPVFRHTPYRGRATAFVVDTVQTVLHFVSEHEDFEDAVVATVNQGDDADTTGALVGMLAGARCGAAHLPWRWLSRLQPATVRAITDQTSGLLALADQLSHPVIA